MIFTVGLVLHHVVMSGAHRLLFSVRIAIDIAG